MHTVICLRHDRIPGTAWSGTIPGRLRHTILLVLLLSTLGRGQGIPMQVLLSDSSQCTGTLISVRDSGLVMERVDAAGKTLSLQLIRFNRISRLSYFDRRATFDPSVVYLSTVVGALLMAGVSWGLGLAGHEPAAGPMIFAGLGAIEGGIFGAFLGWSPPDSSRGQTVITVVTAGVRDQLRQLSEFPNQEPSGLKRRRLPE